ncbi:lipoyl protein ligase domain-containing protein [Aquifex sp.]
MRFYGFHILSPEENMRLDGELLELLEKEEIEPTFRLYKWSELCVSIGKHQEAREFPVKVIRRPTGGGALLHGWDLSFAIVDFKANWGNTFLKIYKRISNLFVELFREFSVKLCMEKNKSYNLDNYFCFFFPTFGELKTREGKKVVSIAMAERKRTFLAHGSVYTRFDYQKASSILGVRENLLRERVTSLEELGVEEESFRRLLYSYLSA